MPHAAAPDPASPVLVVGFKRLVELQAVLAEVRAHHAGRVYVFLDHARAGRDAEERDCAALQRWVRDWAAGDSRVIVRVAAANLGCRRAIPAAIDWVFAEGHDSVVFLEDDCLPSPDFFPYMQQLLARHADDERVMMVSGNQFLPPAMLRDYPHSYYYSRYIHIWGWGTWRRAWRHYDDAMAALDDPAVRDRVDSLFASRAEQRFYEAIWRRQKADPNDSAWGSRWLLACLLQRGLCACPSRNLVRNIGFGGASTHTSRASVYHVVPRQALPQPLSHPPQTIEWRAADRWWFDHLISKRLGARLRRYARRVDPSRVVDEV